MREKIDVDRQVTTFMKTHPEIKTSMLRFATLMGKGADNFIWHYLRRSLVPVVMGYDPLWQVLHMEDALEAIEYALLGDLPGTHNYAAPGVLPLSTLIHMLGGRRLPIPGPLFEAQVRALRLLQFASFGPQHLEFFKYGCVADCTRAFKVRGLRPKHTIHETILSATGEAPIWDE